MVRTGAVVGGVFGVVVVVVVVGVVIVVGLFIVWVFRCWWE